MKQELLKLLYRSFDDELNETDNARLNNALAQSVELREEKERIIQLRSTVRDTAATSFKPFFTEKLMQHIHQTATGYRKDEMFFDSLVQLFRPVVIGAAIVFLFLVSYNLISSEDVSFSSAFAEPKITLEHQFDLTFILTLE